MLENGENIEITELQKKRTWGLHSLREKLFEIEDERAIESGQPSYPISSPMSLVSGELKS